MQWQLIPCSRHCLRASVKRAQAIVFARDHDFSA
jgi:hypothetical protein